jgi:hypothetical protein
MSVPRPAAKFLHHGRALTVQGEAGEVVGVGQQRHTGSVHAGHEGQHRGV